MTIEEYFSQLGLVKGAEIEPRLWLLFVMMHLTGLRGTALLSLQVKDFDYRNRKITLSNRYDSIPVSSSRKYVKRSSVSVISIHSVLANLLNNYIEGLRSHEGVSVRKLYIFSQHARLSHARLPKPKFSLSAYRAMYNREMFLKKMLK